MKYNMVIFLWSNFNNVFLCRYQQFKDFQKRILVATNLFGRGMDIERVNIVFNYDMPEDTDTYLHRVARAGRFGTKVSNIQLFLSGRNFIQKFRISSRFDGVLGFFKFSQQLFYYF